MRVLVTGGAGFIGSALARHLALDLGHEILVADKLTYAANLASLAPIWTAARCSASSAWTSARPSRLSRRLFDGFRPDGVIHLAAESHVDRSISGARAFLDTNVAGTFNLLEAARAYLDGAGQALAGRFRLVHVSTDEVFGSLGPDGLFTEATAYDPSSPYSATKAASDHLARAWHRTYGLPVIVSNCSNNYGPRQFPEKLIPLMILAALEGRPLPVYGDGANVRDWLYVDDHARALAQIFQHGRPGETYNIGGRNERRNIDVVNRVCELMDRYNPTGGPHQRLVAYVADRPGHDHRYAIDATKLETELGWRAEETFETGLAKTVDWYLANPGWWQPLRERVYGGERLGLISA